MLMKELASSRSIARTYLKTFRCQLSKGFFLAQRKLRRLLTARNLKYIQKTYNIGSCACGDYEPFIPCRARSTHSQNERCSTEA